MSVNHGGGNIIMPQQSLNGPDIRTLLQQMGGKAMPKSMRADSSVQARLPYGRLDGFINTDADPDRNRHNQVSGLPNRQPAEDHENP